MPTLTRPDNIPGPFAYNGDKNTIPDSGADAGAASWASGFPPVTQLPLNAGGIPPQRNDFNGAYNALSAHTFFQQSGSYYEWSAKLMYPFAARVLGSDGKLYDWVSASGAGTPAGAQDPATDTAHAYWQPAVTAGDLPQFDGTTIKDINGKLGVPVFTAPTASEDGKAGLVPAPHATSYPTNNLLSVGGFKEVDLAFMHGSAESPALAQNRLCLGGVSLNGANIDTLLRSGFFSDNIITGTLPEGVSGGLLLNLMNLGLDGLYYGQQLLCSYITPRLYARFNKGGIPAGGTPSWYPWLCLTPIPHDATQNGVGHWRAISNGMGGTTLTLPSRGVWAYSISGVDAQGVEVFYGASVLPGGGVVTSTAPNAVNMYGLIWRVA